MADLLVSNAPKEPVRICPACGDVLVSGVCAACAPPPARAYHERASLPMLGKGLVDSRRASAEWSVSPDELDPHTRKAHPSQLRSAKVDYDLPEASPRGKRHTQVYRKGGPAPVARALAAPIPAPARSWTLPEPRPEPESEPTAEPQASSTARHARPASPLRPVSGPVSASIPAAPPTPAAAPSIPQPVAVHAADAPRPELAAAPAHAVDTTEPDLDSDTTPVRKVPPLAWLVLAGGALVGVVAALL